MSNRLHPELNDIHTEEDLRSYVDDRLAMIEALLTITTMSKMFPDYFFEDMKETIAYIRANKDSSNFKELMVLYRILKYDEILVSTRVTEYVPSDLGAHRVSKSPVESEINSKIDEVSREYKKIADPAERVLFDADNSIEVMRMMIDNNIAKMEDIGPLMKRLAVAAEKLRMAIESKDSVEIALEQRATEDVISSILHDMKVAKATGKWKS